MLPLAVQLGTRVRAVARDDGKLSCTSSYEPVDSVVQPLSALAPGGARWSSYVEGCAWLLREAGVLLTGADVEVAGDLPVGAGLSSSASLVCATLCALLDVAGAAWGPQEVALAARRVENDYVGAPVGVMDPMVVMHAWAGHALLIDTRSMEQRPVPLPLAEHGLALLVVDTGSAHATSAAGYAERVEQCAAAARELGVGQLRDVADVADLRALADPLLHARARHVVTENHRVLEAVRLLEAGRVHELGPLLTASHRSLRDDYSVSTPLLDAVVDQALAGGALGARLTGAGFGGSAIALVEQARVDGLTEALTGGLRVRQVTPSSAAHRVGR